MVVTSSYSVKLHRAQSRRRKRSLAAPATAIGARSAALSVAPPIQGSLLLFGSAEASLQIDGQRVSWGTYVRQLQATVTWCDKQLAGDDPFELHSQGGTP